MADEIMSRLAADDASNSASIEKSDFLLHQYDALRNEVVQRITITYQIITIALAAFGAVFAFTNTAEGVYLELLYPLLSLFLLLTYIANSYSIRKLSEFIGESIEKNVSGTGGARSASDMAWQAYRKYRGQERMADLGNTAGSAVFPISSLIAWGVALFTIIDPEFRPIAYYIFHTSITYIALFSSFVIVLASIIIVLTKERILR
jgi:hypothetical protein